MQLHEMQTLLDIGTPMLCGKCKQISTKVEQVDLKYTYKCTQCKKCLDIQLTYWAVFVDNQEFKDELPFIEQGKDYD